MLKTPAHYRPGLDLVRLAALLPVLCYHFCIEAARNGFAVPAALALAHDCFGLMLVRQLARGVPDEVFLSIAVCSVVGTLVLLALYYLLCVRECSRVLLGGVPSLD